MYVFNYPVLLALTHSTVARMFPVLFGDDLSSTLQTAVEPLSEQACNAHLIVILLDRVITALYPDLVSTPRP